MTHTLRFRTTANGDFTRFLEMQPALSPLTALKTTGTPTANAGNRTQRRSRRADITSGETGLLVAPRLNRADDVLRGRRYLAARALGLSLSFSWRILRRTSSLTA